MSRLNLLAGNEPDPQVAGPVNPNPPHDDAGYEVGYEGQAQVGPDPTRPPPDGTGERNRARALTYDSDGNRIYPRGGEDPYEFGMPIIGDIGGIGGLGLTGVDMNQYNAVTREVQPEELTSHQLNLLLAGDSLYMQNADRRGREAAAERGAFGSSLMAESAMRAAIDAGAPIAQADANAYIQAASENLQVVNANINTKLQAATSLANNMNTNRTNAAIAELRERTNVAIAQAQIETQFGLQERDQRHSIYMERLTQEGRLDLFELDADLRRELQANGFNHNIEMSELTQEQRIYLEETFNQPRWHADHMLRRYGMESGIVLNVMQTRAQMINDLNNQDLDGDTFNRSMDWINNWSDTTLEALGMIDFDFGEFDDLGGGG